MHTRPTEKIPIAIEERLMTAAYWMPIREYWIEDTAGFDIVHNPSPAQISERGGLCLIDAIVASRLLDTHLIISNHAVTASHTTMLTMVTDQRPDAIERATAIASNISLAGRAIAESVIARFYGITIESWTTTPRDLDAATIAVTEGAEALLPSETGDYYYEDLGRAWFLMTDTPLVSQICLAPEDLVRSSPEAVIEAVNQLTRLIQTSTERRREMRRNIAKDHGIDRELVVDVLNDQVLSLSPSAVESLKTIYSSTGIYRDVERLDQRIQHIT